MKKTGLTVIILTFLFAVVVLPCGSDDVLLKGHSSALKRIEAVERAYTYLGTPYLLAGLNYQGIDCSGLTKMTLDATVGTKLPRRVSQQIHEGTKVQGVLLPGDLVFFNTTGVPSHVGLYSGGGMVVHAASAGSTPGVIESSLEAPYYKARFVQARRYIEEEIQRIEINTDGGGLEEDVILEKPLTKGTWISLEIVNRTQGDELFQLRVSQNQEAEREILLPLLKDEVGTEKLFLGEEGEWMITYGGNNSGSEGKVLFRVE